MYAQCQLINWPWTHCSLPKRKYIWVPEAGGRKGQILNHERKPQAALLDLGASQGLGWGFFSFVGGHYSCSDTFCCLFVDVWSHTWKCSGDTLGSALIKYSWQSLRSHIIYQGSNLGMPGARQASYPQYYSSGPRHSYLELKFATTLTDSQFFVLTGFPCAFMASLGQVPGHCLLHRSSQLFFMCTKVCLSAPLCA